MRTNRTWQQATFLAVSVAVTAATFLSACAPADSRAAGGEYPDAETLEGTPTTAAPTTAAPTTSPATTTTSLVTTTTTSTVPPAPINTNLTVDIEGSSTDDLVDLVTTATETTIRTFPELPQPDEMDIVIFSSLSYLADNYGDSTAQKFADISPGLPNQGYPIAGLALSSDNLIAISRASGPVTLEDLGELPSITHHEVYHLLSLNGDLVDGPPAIVEGAAHFASSFVEATSPVYDNPDVFLDKLWGGPESRRAPCVVDENFPFAEYGSTDTADEIAAKQKIEQEAIRSLGCNPGDPSSSRPVRASLDAEKNAYNYDEWAGYLYTWTAARGGDPLMFLSDLWTAPGGFNSRWSSVYGVPYSEFEAWVDGQIEADKAAFAEKLAAEQTN